MADHKHTISGPGASDFLASQGGEDLPGISPNKGTTELREDTEYTDPKNLVPALDPPERGHAERTWLIDPNAKKRSAETNEDDEVRKTESD